MKNCNIARIFSLFTAGLHDINLECSEILIIVIAVLLIILFAMMAGMVFYWLRRARRNKWTLRVTNITIIILYIGYTYKIW